MVEYKNLVFKGGGIKSYAYLGTLEVLEKKGVFDGIEKVAGSSAGALYAVLVGLNFSASEIASFIKEVDLNADSKYENDTLKNFYDDYGLYSGEYTIQPFRDLISNKLGNADVTFRDLHDKYAHMGFKDIYMTGTDISEGKFAVFSYKDTPDMKLIDALRISASYPLMYVPFKGDNGHYYVDGGLLDNYPISIFNDKPCESKICPSNPQTLGLFLGDHKNETSLGLNEIISLISNIGDKFDNVDVEQLQKYLSKVDYSAINEGMNTPIIDIVSYISRLFAIYSFVEYKSYNVDEILINDNGFKALDLNITDKQVQSLIDNGREAAEHFFNIHNTNSDFFI